MNEEPDNPTASPWKHRLREHAPVVLVWSCLLVLPIGRVVEVPVMLMAIAGVYLCIRHWRRLRDDPAVRLFAGVFLLAWVPILVSLPDAVRSESTTMMAVNHLRFAFSGIFIVYALSTPATHRRFLTLCAWLLLFWVVDGIVQILAGRDLLGFAIPPSGQINGIFGETGLVYGTLLSVFCPLLWEHAGRRWRPWQVATVIVATVVAIFAAGTRSAWIGVAAVMLAYGLVLWRRRGRGRFPARLAAAVLAGAVIGIGALWASSTSFASRIENAIGAFTGSTAIESDAIGHRTWIWRGAANMIDDNVLNGVGAGGFRYAFPAYAHEDDPFFHGDPPINPSHSHQLWIEMLSETGIVGALGLLALLALLVAAAARAPPGTRRIMVPYGLCLLVAYFPFNSHMAIYSSFWSQIVWWLIALYCAAYGAARSADSARTEPAPA
jgi:O-antigen ligase